VERSTQGLQTDDSAVVTTADNIVDTVTGSASRTPLRSAPALSTRFGTSYPNTFATHGSTNQTSMYPTIGTTPITTNTPRLAADLGVLFAFIGDVEHCKIIAKPDHVENSHPTGAPHVPA
jgi:hypothetical protein